MIGEIILPAFSVLFGLQLLRVTIPQMVWLFGDRFGMNAANLGIIAIAVFAFSFLAGLITKFSGRYRLIVFSAFGLGLARLLVQVQLSEPLITMIISMAGVILFGLFLSAYTDEIRTAGRNAVGSLGIGILTGLVLDTTLHGAFGTYDIVWQPGIIPIGLTVLLVLVLWFTVYSLPHREITEKDSHGTIWTWLATGPFLFLQMTVLQNIARHTVTTGWAQPYVFGWVLLSQIAGLLAAVFLLKRHKWNMVPVSVISGIILFTASVFPFPTIAWIAAVAVFAEQVMISILFILILMGTILKKDEKRFSSINTANGTGFLLLGIITLAYYTVYQINLPYNNTILESISAGLIALCGIIPSMKTSGEVSPVKISWILPGLSLVLLLLPLAGIITRSEPDTETGDGFPVKMMTYNLHNGFNPQGDLDLEALAQVIEEADPDIIALQEISRGWLISGRVDMLDWLSQRLELPYVSGPTEGPLWGNAVLSRYPIIESVNYDLPPRDLFLLRGYLLTRIDIGKNETLNLIATHFHHVEEDSEIRQQQVPVILDAWNNQALTIITGDLNAQPDSIEIAMLRDAGLTDVMADSVPPESYTFSSVTPFERIDYIWITPDLKAANAKVLQVTASDHMPLVVEISR